MHCDPFTDEQIPAMLGALGNKRDRALFALGISTGLRVSELLAVKRRDLLDESGELRSRLVSYHTKGDKKRVVAVNPLARPYLLAWLKEQERIGLLRGDTLVFCTLRGKPFRRWHVWRIIRAAARKAGLSPAWGGAFGTHSMRKTFGRATYEYWQKRGRTEPGIEPLMKCKVALGHASLQSTQHYLQFMACDVEEGTMALYEGLTGGHKIGDALKPVSNGPPHL